MAKADIRKCRYCNCKHLSQDIDTAKEPYKKKGSKFYHEDCWILQEQMNQKDAQTKADIQLIRNLWIERINNTVVLSQLYQVLNEYIARGVSSEYLVFTVEYCIKNKCVLRYPYGLKYYIDNQEIKDAYARTQIAKNRVKQEQFVSVDNDDAPKFTVKNKKMTGFGKILGGDT